MPQIPASVTDRPRPSLRARRHRAWRAALVVVCVPALVAGLAGTPVAASPPGPGSAPPAAPGATAPALPADIAHDYATELTLPDGSRAYVDVNGQAIVLATNGSVLYRRVASEISYDAARSTPTLPSEREIIAQLSGPTPRPYDASTVLAEFTGAPVPGVTASPALGAARPGVFAVDVGTADPQDAADALAAMPGVAWAEPDWTVHGANPSTVVVPDSVVRASTVASPNTMPAKGSLPTNYGLTSSAQSTWMTPGLDAARAYARIVDTYGKLPGTGEIITTVGIGGIRYSDSGVCAGDVEFFGPTTVVISGQSYLDMPSLPLVPTYTADSTGQLDPLGEACPNEEAMLDTIGVSVSSMSALPHDKQRAGAVGQGLTDLLGIAPGAKYRVVVPAAYEPTTRDLAAALLGAAGQQPAPTVIVVTAHVGGSAAGFPDRSLEDARLLRSTVASIVAQGITVVLPAGDGVTVQRVAAVGASGGAARTDIVASSRIPTQLSDLLLSTAPSSVPDTGAIVVAASTTNDIFAVQPHAAGTDAARDTQAYPTVRWTGSTTYASGYGTRADVSAPGDSVLGLRHQMGGGVKDVAVALGSGTAFSAAEVAATAAVARQVARLSGQPLESPAAVRDLLVRTARELPAVPQVAPDQEFPPQVDVGAVVDALMSEAPPPSVLRVAVAQRRPVDGIGATFETATDPTAIDLVGPAGPDGKPSGRNARAWITIAPDWVGLPATATYDLRATNDGSTVLSTSASARLQPGAVLAAAGLPLESEKPRTVTLRYSAYVDGAPAASVLVPLTFGPAGTTSAQVPAPVVAPVVTGTTIRVAYDLRGVAPLDKPELLVSHAGRTNPLTGTRYTPAVRVPLDSLSGTIDVPVAALDGNGIYGVGIHYADFVFEDQTVPQYSDFGFVRVQEITTTAPGAPLVAASPAKKALSHLARIGMSGSVTVSWDVRDVPGATGATLEVSAPGPNLWSLTSTFSNPEGSRPDDNGVDTPATAAVVLTGTTGVRTFTVDELSLVSGMTHGLRLLPTGSKGRPAGSASTVSTVVVGGAPVVSGGDAERGFVIDPNGSVGLMTSLDLSHDTQSAVELFDQETGANVGVPLHTYGAVYSTAGSGAYGGNAALVVEREQFTDEPVGMSLFDDIADGDPTPWYVPKPSRYVFAGSGADATSPTGAFLLRDTKDTGSGPFRMAFGAVGAGTFGPVYDVSAGLQDLPYAPEVRQVAYDAGAGRSVITLSPDMYETPIVESVDDTTGKTKMFTLDTIGMTMGMDVLSSPARAMITTFDYRVSLLDLDSGAARSIDMPGLLFGDYVAADDPHGLFLVMQAAPEDINTNNNALSQIVVFDADMNVVDTLSQFNFYDTPLSPYVQQVQVDPSTRTGWAIGYLATKLVRFSY